jgi:hypothetical protein
VRFDLPALQRLDAPEADVFRRYVTRLRVERGDFNRRVFTVRADDVAALARALGCDEPIKRDETSRLSDTCCSAASRTS